MRDEMTTMGFGERARVLAEKSLLLEEFLAREAAAGRLEALKGKLKPLARPVLVHGHCHQKAFGAVSPVLDVLKLIPGVQPQLIDSSCCGMAGSFGYEATHHAVSMEMAELSLLPAVRSVPDAIVVADGTSCRHQIHDGAQRQALHAAVVLAAQL
jgi:Fe-S oxidoreductase